MSRALLDQQERTAETLYDGDSLTFLGQAKQRRHFTLSWKRGGYVEYQGEPRVIILTVAVSK